MTSTITSAPTLAQYDISTVPDLRTPYRDLAPTILRQRLVIEGTPSGPISRGEIVEYLKDLGVITDMVVLTEPVTHESPMYGWAGWVHWETSGAHFYAWDQPQLFFSVDIYTCKAFDPNRAVAFTANRFGARDIVAKSA